MAAFDITWTNFTVNKKHDIDKDKPYLWVYGLLIDAKTLQSQDYVIKRRSDSDNLGKKFGKGDSSSVPSDLDISHDVSPLLGLSAGGVVVVAWENAMTRDSVIADAYDAGADALNDAIRDHLKSGDPLGNPTAAEMAAISDSMASAIAQTIKDGWTVFQLVPDHYIGSGSTTYTFSGNASHDVHYRFVNGSTDYELKGTLAYDAQGSTPSSPPPPPPPGKVLTSPPPSAPVRH